MRALALSTRVSAIALVSAVVLSLGACGAFAERFSERNKLVGCWYGHGEQETRGEDVYWIIERSGNGDFRARFRSFVGNTIGTDQTEIGRWSYSTGLYTVVTTAITQSGRRTSPVHFEDSYDVPNVDARPLVYTQLSNNIRHLSQPVSCDFELPKSPERAS